jgi:hypothetical protein
VGAGGRRAKVTALPAGLHSSAMAETEPLKPFGRATLRELIEESRRLRQQAQELRKRTVALEQAIHERARDRPPPDVPPTGENP